MNRHDNSDVTEEAEPVKTQQDASQQLANIGQRLIQTRQHRCMDIETVADALNIFSRHLRCLEAGKRLDVAPAYARGYLKLYADYLSLDVEQILASYDEALAPVTEPEAEAPAAASVSSRPSMWQPVTYSLQCAGHTLQRVSQRYLRAGWSVSLPAGLLAAVCVAYYSIDASRLESEELVLANLQAQEAHKLGLLASEAVNSADEREVFAVHKAPVKAAYDSIQVAAVDDMSEGELAEATLDAVQEQSELALLNNAVPVQHGASGVITVGEAAVSNQNRPTIPGEKLADAFEPVGPGAVEMISQVQQSDRLVITVYEDSWIDVRDNAGARLYRDLARAGRRIDVSGELPFALHVGNAPGLELRLNGEPVEINRYRADNSARLTLASHSVH